MTAPPVPVISVWTMGGVCEACEGLLPVPEWHSGVSLMFPVEALFLRQGLLSTRTGKKQDGYIILPVSFRVQHYVDKHAVGAWGRWGHGQ